ncbi:bifunctional 5-dehydro-2-deoxygluconokinase/5-dehydro-2-deoxyphosphogluconate aldolase [Celeribacter halophilus]|uniref:5-dehydro-2-deoxygluconokinase n=1 Tax=Celeribacter halophilus TaxID=576117 RepID=A0A1I3W331_9RHOB|nr:5-dehydro-2-deoxygluconokinase [Celeribacter halophilus]PZX09911.1 5-dehydro-2-deoxygluconokinase [Celeribacter halophilus]SFK02044.1 5-dehydro-2-deoxygluconokinase [Celeribacter halophilus]
MSNQPTPQYDIITIGRTCADLYADQVGCRMEDARSFSKYVGGCPTNIAVGGARLGLKTALLSRVGDDQIGRFVRETLEAEGVETCGLKTDPERLTAMAFLGLEDDKNFPLLFVRNDCADAALSEEDIDPDFIRSAAAIVVTGTHFSKPHLEAASFKAMEIARAAGRKIIFDIDYRPNLWGLLGAGEGDVRFVANPEVTARVQRILPNCDLVVGTDEEVHIAGGSTDTREALLNIRKVTDAMIVLKTGPKGCLVFPADIPGDLEQGISSRGFPVEVFNVLGAGDGFLAGFLRGYVRDLPLEECCRIANACGAFAVSRHGCAPAYPTWEELQFFLKRGVINPRLREDAELEHVHWASTRRGTWDNICAFAIDHRSQLEDMAAQCGAAPERIMQFKDLAVDAMLEARRPDIQLGTLLDSTYGRQALFRVEKEGLWIGRPVEKPGSRPLTFEGAASLGAEVASWPTDHVIKCLVFYNPDDPEELRRTQIDQLHRLASAARKTGHEYLIEIISTPEGSNHPSATAEAMQQIYAEGIRPDWWKLSDQTEAGWGAVGDVIEQNDKWCRGVLLLGLDASAESLAASIARAAASPHVRGFAVGRTIFASTAKAWLSGDIGDIEARTEMKRAFSDLIDIWITARKLN